MSIPENWTAAIAPAKYSFVWNVPLSAWAQWTGIRKDPILRNLGEVLAVFARFDLTSATPAQGLFDSTVDLRGQLTSEDLLWRLAPPKWPEEVLGQIDRQKAAHGKALFADHCAGCHTTWPYRWSDEKKEGKRFIENAIVSVSVVGTDATQLASPVFDPRPLSIPGTLRDYLDPPYRGASPFEPDESTL